MVWNALRKGINQGISNWRVVLILWLFNFLFSLLFFFPSNFIFSKAFSKSLIHEKIVPGDLSITFEFMEKYKNEVGLLFIFAFSILFIFWIVNLFLSGGIISILHEGSKNVRDIFSKSPVYFWKFMKLSFLFIPLIIVFFVFWGISRKGIELFFNLTGSEKFTFYFSLLIFFLFGLILIILRMLFDYGRIRIVLEGEKIVTISLMRTIKWIFLNFWKTLSLCIFLTILLLLYYIPLYLTFKITTFSAFQLFLVFLFTQLLFLIRSFLSLLFYSSQLNLYKSLRY